MLYQHLSQTDNRHLPLGEAQITQRIADIRKRADYYLKNDIASEEDKTLALKERVTLQLIETRLLFFLPPRDDITLSI